MMMIYDDSMRTIIDIPNEKIRILDSLCKVHNVSRAELIRRAIDKYLVDTPDVRREASFGIWSKKKLNSLDYESSLRSEWS
jgi:metal-responsive CopG/Arc/MetJ family transcriptional regulator